MKKITLFLWLICLFCTALHAQLMVSKLVGKDASKYGLGSAVFTYFDFPFVHENQSFRVELMDLALFPTKGENFLHRPQI